MLASTSGPIFAAQPAAFTISVSLTSTIRVTSFFFRLLCSLAQYNITINRTLQLSLLFDTIAIVAEDEYSHNIYPTIN